MGLDADSEVQAGPTGRSEEPDSRAMPGETGTHSGTLPGILGNCGNSEKTLGNRHPPDRAENPIPPQRPEKQETERGMVPGGTWLRSRRCDPAANLRRNWPTIRWTNDHRKCGRATRLFGSCRVVQVSQKAHYALLHPKTLGFCMLGMLGTAGKLDE